MHKPASPEPQGRHYHLIKKSGRYVIVTPEEFEKFVATPPMLAAALSYATQKGWFVFPAKLGLKESHKSARFSKSRRRWGATNSRAELREDFMKFPNANLGVPTGMDNGIFVIEADTIAGHPKGHVDGLASIKQLEAEHGPLPETLMAISPSGSVHRYYKHPGYEIKIWGSASAIAPGVDIMGDGQMVIAPPSIKPGAGAYRWLNDLPIAEPPEWLVEFAKLNAAQRKSKAAKSQAEEKTRKQKTDSKLEAPANQIAAALDDIANPDLNFDDWNTIGMAAHRATKGSEIAFAAFDRFSRKSNKYDADFTHEKWHVKFDGSPATEVGAAKIFALADEVRRAKKRASGKPLIQIRSRDIPEIAKQAEQVLISSGCEIFQRGGHLVRPVIEDADASHGRRTKVARLIEVSPIYLRNLLTQIIDWERYASREKKWLPVGAPDDVGLVILSQVGHWTFPRIGGVITTPTLRPDGSLLMIPGYDLATGLLLVTPPPMPAISVRPTKADALAALKLLEDLLSEFPFTKEEDGAEVSKAVALSGLITPVARGAFPVTPLHFARAPVAGSGKSFLVDIVATIAIGMLMPVISAGQKEDELEKRLGAAAMTGQPLLSIDNVDGELRSVALCQLVERQIVELRILGKSEQKRIETRALSMFGTGNNVAIYGDLTRRTLITTLDPNMEQPETRAFEANPVATVLNDRGKYIAACLTICRAYIVAGYPDKPTPLASFEGWSDLVRGALIWLGKADPVKSLDIARDEDPERNAISEVMSEWEDYVGHGAEHASTAAEVVKMAFQTNPDPENHKEPLYPKLRQALSAACGGNLDAERLGYWLRGCRGRWLDGRRFWSKRTTGHPTQWWLEPKG